MSDADRTVSRIHRTVVALDGARRAGVRAVPARGPLSAVGADRLGRRSARLLGGLYYATATRLYQAKASLLVLQTGADVTNTTMTAEGVRQGLDAHLRAALLQRRGAGRGGQTPGTGRIGSTSRGCSPENWPDVIRGQLDAPRTVRLTNIIEISYRSKAPRAAVGRGQRRAPVLSGVHGQNAQGDRRRTDQRLHKEKVQIEELLAKNAGRSAGGPAAVRRSGHSRRQQRRPSDGAARDRDQPGPDQSPASAAGRPGHAQRHRSRDPQRRKPRPASAGAGRDRSAASCCWPASASASTTSTTQSRNRQAAARRSNRAHASCKNISARTIPRIIDVNDRIRMTQSYLANYQDKSTQRLGEIRQQQLGPMLMQMVRQRLDESLSSRGRAAGQLRTSPRPKPWP